MPPCACPRRNSLSGIRKAIAFGPHACGPPGVFGKSSTSENCLYLNVFTPHALRADAIFSCPTLLLDQSLSKYVPTYAYEFSDENAPARYPSPGFPYGAAHASELQYLFNLPNSAPGSMSVAQRQLATAMQQEWTSFVKSGLPSAAGAAAWPRFTAAGQAILSLVPPHPVRLTSFASEHHCAFWALGGD